MLLCAVQENDTTKKPIKVFSCWQIMFAENIIEFKKCKRREWKKIGYKYMDMCGASKKIFL